MSEPKTKIDPNDDKWKALWVAPVEAFNKYVEENGVSVDEMTDTQKQLAYINAVLELEGVANE